MLLSNEVSSGTGNGRPLWKFNNDYLDRDDVNVEVFEKHPEKVKAEESRKLKAYNLNALIKRIGCEATASLFIDTAMIKNDKSYIMDAINAVDNINVKSSEPFNLYKDTLEKLGNLNFEDKPPEGHLQFLLQIEELKKATY